MKFDIIYCLEMKEEENTRSSTNSTTQLYTVPSWMKKKFFLREIFFVLYHLSRLGLAIAIIVIISQTSTRSIRQSEGFNHMQEVLDIWEKDVIIEITTTSTYNCPEGYESYSSFQWPGTKEGCVCTTTLADYDYIHVLPGQCSYRLIDAGCTIVPPKQPIPFAFWKPNQLICIKRIRGLNFFSNMTENVMGKNLQTCAEGSPHEFISLLQYQCPITSLSNSSSTYPNLIQSIDFSYARSDNYPMVDLRVSEYSFCSDYGKPNISPNRFENYNLEVVEIEHCSEVDPRVIEVDEITEQQFFQNNERIYDVIMNQLPIYPEPIQDYVYKLGVVRYPPWNIACRNSEQFNLSRARDMFLFDSPTQSAEYCMNITIFLVCLWGVAYTVVSVIRRVMEVRSRSRNHITYLPDSQVLKINPNLLSSALKLNLCGEIVVFIILFALALATLVNVGVQYIKTDHFEGWFRQSKLCMDGSSFLLQWTQDAYIEPMQNIIRDYLICIISAVVIFCLDLIYSVWRLQKGDLSQQNFSDLFSGAGQESNSDEQGKEDIESEKEVEKDEGKKKRGDGDLRKTGYGEFNPTEESLASMNPNGSINLDLDEEFEYKRPKKLRVGKSKHNSRVNKMEFFDFE